MAIASRLKWFLDVNRLPYDASVPELQDGAAGSTHHCCARCTALHDDAGYVLAVWPADQQLSLPQLNSQLERELCPVESREVKQLFFDCDPDALPAVGAAYGVPTVIDESLLQERELFFEAGSAGEWLHMSVDDFLVLSGDLRRGPISKPH